MLGFTYWHDTTAWRLQSQTELPGHICTVMQHDYLRCHLAFAPEGNITTYLEGLCVLFHLSAAPCHKLLHCLQYTRSSHICGRQCLLGCSDLFCNELTHLPTCCCWSCCCGSVWACARKVLTHGMSMGTSSWPVLMAWHYHYVLLEMTCSLAVTGWC